MEIQFLTIRFTESDCQKLSELIDLGILVIPNYVFFVDQSKTKKICIF